MFKLFRENTMLSAEQIFTKFEDYVKKTEFEDYVKTTDYKIAKLSAELFDLKFPNGRIYTDYRHSYFPTLNQVLIYEYRYYNELIELDLLFLAKQTFSYKLFSDKDIVYIGIREFKEDDVTDTYYVVNKRSKCLTQIDSLEKIDKLGWIENVS